MTTLRETAHALQESTNALSASLRPQLEAVQKMSVAVLRATNTLAPSWSGSVMGYHSSLYFRDFEQPPLQSSFSKEWGGLNGLPAGWTQRTSDEVQQRIEKLSGFKIDDLDDSTDTILKSAKELQSEIIIQLSSLHQRPDLDQEKKLLGELENFKWAYTVGEYINDHTPKHAVSRDSEAVYQGMKVPAHTFFAALASEKNSECIAIANFLKLATRLLRQIELNTVSLEVSEEADQKPVKAVLAICDRFHLVAEQLKQRRQQRTTLEILDEYDVQDLMHALLRQYFDDIRAEEWTPSYGGSSSRMDFLLKEHAIVVEAKMTRKGLTAKGVSEQLIIDVAKYRQHPDCKTLICFVYDPAGLVKNPRGVERDLVKLPVAELDVICVVVP